MSFGPIELLVLKFPGNQFKGEIVPALKELVDNETIRIIDIVFVTKDAEGNLKAVEVSDLDGEDYAIFDPLVSDVLGLLSKGRAAVMIDTSTSSIDEAHCPQSKERS